MLVKIEDNTVRIPGHPKAVAGHVPKGTIVDVETWLGRSLVAQKRASAVDEKDLPRGPMRTISASGKESS